MSAIVWKDFPVALVSSVGKNYDTREELDEIARQINEENEVGFIEGTQNFMGFMSEWKERGFWRTMYDKPFSEVLGGWLKETAHDVGLFILGNGDFFFMFPCLVFLIGTFMVGKHKYTKWIIPLAFLYFLSRCFFWIIR